MTFSQALRFSGNLSAFLAVSERFNAQILKRLTLLVFFVLFGNSAELMAQCASSGNSTDGYYTGIRQVIFNTINNATILEDNAYSDFTGISTTVSRTSTYDLSVYVNTDGNYTVNTMVWVDWNQDADFADAGESFILGTATNVVNGLTSASPYAVTIPATATLGTTIMRVSTKWNGYPTSCQTGFDGEVEDYSINVVLPAEINVQGKAIDIVDGDVSPSTLDDTDFGSIYSVSGSVSHTFTIQNSGGDDLLLSGNPRVAISGAQASDFSVTTQPAAAITGGGGSSTFVIHFDPSSTGLRIATVTIASNDADENPYNFQIQGAGSGPPEIDVTGKGISIFDGDTSPSVNDDTYFGSADIVTGLVNHTFTVSSSGTSSLILTGAPAVVLSGTHAADFSVTTQPAASISPSGGSSVFVVRFDPSATGIRTATISIANNDPDENPYNFSIQGTGSAAPEMDIKGNGISIVDGVTSTSVPNGTDFGNTDINTGLPVHTFSIINTGSGDLTLTGSPRVSVFGAQASDFSVTQQPASATVAAQGGTQTFQITFNPPLTGLRQATVSITNNDADESPYTFAVRGTGTINPEIDIRGNGISIANGDNVPGTADSTDVGSVLVGGNTRHITYSIFNSGPAALHLTGSWPLVAISGVHAGDFSVHTPPIGTIAPGSSTTFKIGFSPLTSGTRSATLTINNDDLDESSYSFAIQGTGTSNGSIHPEIDIQGNLISIDSLNNTPSANDGTYIGQIAVVGGALNQTFMINNSGVDDLLLTSIPLVNITGSHAADFSITQQPSTPVSPSGAVPFTVTFNPSAPGLRSALITVENNDENENPYSFIVQGFGLTYPEIEVQGNGFVISSGDASPSTLDSTDFGDVTPSFGQALATYTIYNSGDSTLVLTGNPLVSVTGNAANEFVVTSMPTASIPVGGNSDFTIKFDPAQTGSRNVTVSIENNDSNESPYSFNLTGNGAGSLTPFPCISRFYHVYGDNGVIAYMDATVNPYAYTTIKTVGYSINGAGYNIEDGLLYAFEQDNYPSGNNIVRIDGDLQVDVLTAVAVPFLSWRADFDISGNMYFWDDTGTKIAIFDASEGTITYQTRNGATWVPIDMAFLEYDGNFYGIHGSTLYQYDPMTNTVSTVSIAGRLADDYSSGTNSAYYGAAWSDDTGYIFTTNSQSGRMYKISPTGTSIYVGLGAANLNKSDGASCPLVPAPLPTTGTVGDFVWIDSDANGVHDAGEPGLPGVTVSLYSIDNLFIASAITDQNGEYSFTNLSPSEYYIKFTNPPSGFSLTQQKVGSAVSDSDPNASTGQTDNFFVGVGLVDESIDAGYTATGVGDFIWNDNISQNGAQDYGEAGVPGVTVELVTPNTPYTNIATTTSNAFGYYSFRNVTPGTYRIRVSNLPGGYAFVSRNNAADDIDSDIRRAIIALIRSR